MNILLLLLLIIPLVMPIILNQTRYIIQEFQTGTANTIDLDMSQNMNYLVSQNSDGTTNIYKKVGQFLKLFQSIKLPGVVSVSISSNSSLIYAFLEAGELRIFKLNQTQFKLIQRITFNSKIRQGSISKVGNIIGIIFINNSCSILKHNGVQFIIIQRFNCFGKGINLGQDGQFLIFSKFMFQLNLHLWDGLKYIQFSKIILKQSPVYSISSSQDMKFIAVSYFFSSEILILKQNKGKFSQYQIIKSSESSLQLKMFNELLLIAGGSSYPMLMFNNQTKFEKMTQFNNSKQKLYSILLNQDKFIFGKNKQFLIYTKCLNNKYSLCQNNSLNNSSNKTLKLAIIIGSCLTGALLCCTYNFNIVSIPLIIHKLCQKKNDNKLKNDQKSNNMLIMPNKIKVGKQQQDEKQWCGICLGDNLTHITICKHKFHLKCLLMWMRKSPLCPMCRKPIKKNQITMI